MDHLDAVRQARAAVREAMGARSVDEAAALSHVSPNTILRVLRGENVTVKTVGRICAALGAAVEIRVATNRK